MELLTKQKEYFATGATLPIPFRIAMLKSLYREIQTREKEITLALHTDLGKSDIESIMCEVGMTLHEISYMIKHLKKWAKPQRVKTPLAQFPGKSYTLATPYGSVLIMSPWNYPFLLTMGPLCNAIAAGNTAIVKPSAYSPATAALLRSIISNCFPEKYVAVVTGGRKENAFLLEQKFDFVFFTGSSNVGKEVLRHTAEHLTPAVLELGGKSPCIVDNSANIPLAAKRIVFGKLLNCGQTCVAPDYILCHESVKDQLVKELKKQNKLPYGNDHYINPHYGKIINAKHFERLTALIDPQKTVMGGICKEETLQIAPTILDNVTWNDPVMQEEIFGPVLPVLTYQKWEELFPLLQNKPKPLALYLFTENRAHANEITHRISYGGGCINDVVVHLATTNMGFGGVGESGMGSYHGKVGFETFSHRKSILHKKNWLDLPMRYQPYRSKLYEKLVRMFLK